MLDHVWMSSVKLHLYTDAAGAIGYGAIIKSHWFYGCWLNSLNECTITFKELYPIVLAVEVWGHLFQNSCLLYHSDNQAVVWIVSKQTLKDPMVMKLVRRLVLSCMKLNI